MQHPNKLHHLFEQALKNLSASHREEAGIVLSVGDAICKVQGLSHAFFGELVIFDGGNEGIVFDLGDETCSVFLLHDMAIAQDEGVRRTYETFSVPVSFDLLGRVIDVQGNGIDGLPMPWIKNSEKRSIERSIKGIADRKPVQVPLSTGIFTIDTLVPIGRGQRQLFIGNRNTGKTASVIDTIINQRDNNVICIYVGIAQRQSSIARLVNVLQEQHALAYTIIVASDAGKPSLHHYLAPYVGCTIAEYFADEGKDVLIVYDDLSSHAIAYREMSLLMKRSPGREAYPGDVFYLHSRLLERAGNFLDGGSITALPIVQIQENDLAAYIPTNLISITDGQVFFDTKLFNNDTKPAINTELSVSRVGGAAQPRMINKLSKALRLELAQYRELAAFAQFGSDLDVVSAQRIKRGELLIELLRQDLHVHYSIADEILMLYLFKKYESHLYGITDLKKFISWFLSFFQATQGGFYDSLANLEQLSEAISQELGKIIESAFEIYGTRP